MIEIKEVKTKRQIKEFIEFPLNLYKGNSNFVPPLYGDEKALFKSNYHYYEQAEAVYYNAYKNGKMVGRIAGILQHASNERWNQKRVRFNRFDSIDDQEVANALFKAVEDWAVQKGMEEVVGPLGFSDLEREGLLIEGFDELATFEEQYNYDYYQRLIENLGYEKEVDWEERKLYLPKNIDPRYEKLTKQIMKRYNLRLGYSKNTKDFLKRYSEQFFELYEQTYDFLYQSTPLTDRVKKSLLSSFKLIVDIKHVAVILDENDKVVCFGLCFPSIAKAVQKSGGRLTLGCILRVLRALKKPEIIDLAMIGVSPEYKMKGVSTVLFYEVIKMLQQGAKYAETNLTLETNKGIINQWKMFDAVVHKRRRSFIKKI